MTKKSPNVIIKFDDSNPTQEEKDKAILDLLSCLSQIAIINEIKKIKNAKERNELEKNLMDFNSKVLLRLGKELKNK